MNDGNDASVFISKYQFSADISKFLGIVFFILLGSSFSKGLCHFPWNFLRNPGWRDQRGRGEPLSP